MFEGNVSIVTKYIEKIKQKYKTFHLANIYILYILTKQSPFDQQFRTAS